MLRIDFVLFALLLLFTIKIKAQQNVGIGTNNPHASALLELRANDKGFLPPRLSTPERLNISNPAEGLVVYDIDLQGMMLFSAGLWQKLMPESNTNSTLFLTANNIAANPVVGNQTLLTYFLPANTLIQNGDKVEFTFYGNQTEAPNGLQFLLGGINIMDNVLNPGAFVAQLKVYRRANNLAFWQLELINGGGNMLQFGEQAIDFGQGQAFQLGVNLQNNPTGLFNIAFGLVQKN